MITLNIIPPDLIKGMKTEITPYLDSALDKSGQRISSQEVLEAAYHEKIILVHVMDNLKTLAICALEFVYFTYMTALNVFTLSGERIDEWLEDLITLVDSIARNMNCSEIWVKGRKGWEKKLETFDFDYLYTALVRKIT